MSLTINTTITRCGGSPNEYYMIDEYHDYNRPI